MMNNTANSDFLQSDAKQRYQMVLRVVGMLFMVAAVIMLPPIFIGLIYQDGDIQTFVYSSIVLFALGFILLLAFRSAKTDFKIRTGFILVALSWIILSLSGAIPLYFAESLNLSVVDAIFESTSALTTTGATIIGHLDDLPHAILFYRHILQWLGGMGIIVLAIAILPMLRIGGMQMFKAETPGPMKDQKLTPRITETAKALWFLYLTMTLVCALAYFMAGMNLFDAVCHAFSTIAIGGMSTHDISFAYFNNSMIELIAIIFMFIAGINFALHFFAWRSASLKPYFKDTEIKTYASIIFVSTIITAIILFQNDVYSSLYEAIRHAAFQVVSITTTTGFTTSKISELPNMVPFLLILLGSIGACAGSTSGGIKMIRVVLLTKLSMRELYRLIHPHGHFIIKLDGKTVNYRVLDSISAFILQFIFIACILTLLLLLFGEDLNTAFTSVLSAIANIGPALGDASENYSSLTDGSKWTLALAMIFGRLEIFTLFILLIPAYWES